jgi:hypothetical protein
LTKIDEESEEADGAKEPKRQPHLPTTASPALGPFKPLFNFIVVHEPLLWRSGKEIQAPAPA